MAVVASSKAVIDPGAVVVAFRDAVAAEAAVLGSRRLDEFAGAADGVWPEEDLVVWVVMELVLVRGGGDVVSFVCSAEIGEVVGWGQEDWDRQDKA